MQNHRRDEIQGLRAIAVLLVIANHLRDWPSGGFIGVDVFFVVSGYVITRLLLREAAHTGRISLSAFYRRRVKRIMPAAVLVLVTTTAIAALVFSPSQQAQTRGDVTWALGSIANWRFVILGTDYLHAADAVSPVQHFWSLSVEEQFYFAWPLIVIVAVLATRKRPASLRMVLGAAAAAIVIGSFAFALHESAQSPTSAYFSTLSRGWELALGCGVACSAPLTRRIPAAFQTPLAWAGLSGVVASIFLIDASSRFPAPAAALPTLATVAVLVAGERAPVQNLYPLTNRIARWIGDLSYSLYLWHFPVLIFLDAVLPGRGRRYQIIALLLIATLSLLSYYFVENPLRHASWRIPRALPRARFARIRTRPALAAMALLVAGASVSAFAIQSRPADDIGAVDLAGVSWTPTSAVDEAQQHRVMASLGADAWPTISPAVMNPGVTAQAPEWIQDGCLGDERRALPDPYRNALRCVYGDPKGARTLALVGDSHAISYLPGVRAALTSGWRIEVYTLEECPAVWVEVSRGDGAPHPDCARFHQEVAQHLTQEHPDVVMMTSATVALTQVTSRATGEALTAEWTAGATRAIRALASASDRLILVDDPPSTANLQSCYTALNGPQRCVVPVNSFYLQMARAQRAAVASLHDPSVSYPSNTQWFCSAEGMCPSFIGTTPVMVDGFHLTDAMARELAPLLREALVSTGARTG